MKFRKRLAAFFVFLIFTVSGSTTSASQTTNESDTVCCATAENAGGFEGDWPAFVDAEILYDSEFEGDQAERRTVDLYVPEGAGPFPLVMWAHGGGFESVNPDKGYNVAEFLQQHGIVVALVGYRLSPEGSESPHDAAMSDYMDALNYVVGRSDDYRVATDRVVLAGHSTGGGMATRAAVNPYWLESVGLSQAQIALCIPVDQTGWNLERLIIRSRSSIAPSTQVTFRVTRDDVQETGYAPVGATRDGMVYPFDTPLYDHPTILYPDVEGQMHPKNLSVIHNIDARTPPHWIPYSTLSADRPESTAEFVAAMHERGRDASFLELTTLNHGRMKSAIGQTNSEEAVLLSNGFLEAISAFATSSEEGAPSERDRSFLSASPNPARGAVRITLSGAEPAVVEVFDVLGRRVATLADGVTADAVVWDTNGVPPGVYHVRALFGGAASSVAVTVVR